MEWEGKGGAQEASAGCGGQRGNRGSTGWPAPSSVGRLPASATHSAATRAGATHARLQQEGAGEAAAEGGQEPDEPADEPVRAQAIVRHTLHRPHRVAQHQQAEGRAGGGRLPRPLEPGEGAAHRRGGGRLQGGGWRRAASGGGCLAAGIGRRASTQRRIVHQAAHQQAQAGPQMSASESRRGSPSSSSATRPAAARMQAPAELMSSAQAQGRWEPAHKPQSWQRARRGCGTTASCEQSMLHPACPVLCLSCVCVCCINHHLPDVRARGKQDGSAHAQRANGRAWRHRQWGGDCPAEGAVFGQGKNWGGQEAGGAAFAEGVCVCMIRGGIGMFGAGERSEESGAV